MNNDQRAVHGLIMEIIEDANQMEILAAQGRLLNIISFMKGVGFPLFEIARHMSGMHGQELIDMLGELRNRIDEVLDEIAPDVSTMSHTPDPSTGTVAGGPTVKPLTRGKGKRKSNG